MTEAERRRLVYLLGMTGSAHDGEALNALRLTWDLLRRCGADWDKLLSGEVDDLKKQLEIAEDACRFLLAENEALRRQGDDWRDVGRRDHRRCAAWALQQELDDKIALKPFERSFLGTVRYWGRPLTEKQKPVFETIIDRVEAVTGETAP